jgi:hypothetical protein
MLFNEILLTVIVTVACVIGLLAILWKTCESVP